MNHFRIGHGYDVHALAPGLPLRLGGVTIPHSAGCVALFELLLSAQAGFVCHSVRLP